MTQAAKVFDNLASLKPVNALGTMEKNLKMEVYFTAGFVIGMLLTSMVVFLYLEVQGYRTKLRYIFVRDVGTQGPVTYHCSRQRFVPLQGYQHGIEAVTHSDPYKREMVCINKKTYKDAMKEL